MLEERRVEILPVLRAPQRVVAEQLPEKPVELGRQPAKRRRRCPKLRCVGEATDAAVFELVGAQEDLGAQVAERSELEGELTQALHQDVEGGRVARGVVERIEEPDAVPFDRVQGRVELLQQPVGCLGVVHGPGDALLPGVDSRQDQVDRRDVAAIAEARPIPQSCAVATAAAKARPVALASAAARTSAESMLGCKAPCAPNDDGLPDEARLLPGAEEAGEHILAGVLRQVGRFAEAWEDERLLSDSNIGRYAGKEPSVLAGLQRGPPVALAHASVAEHHRDVDVERPRVGLGDEELVPRRRRAVLRALDREGVADQLAEVGRAHACAHGASSDKKVRSNQSKSFP